MTLDERRRNLPRMCRGCGCTDRRACPGGCSWILLDLDAPTGVCSRCAESAGWRCDVLAVLGVDDMVENLMESLR